MDEKLMEQMRDIIDNAPLSQKESLSKCLFEMIPPEQREACKYVASLGDLYDENPYGDLLIEGLKCSNFGSENNFMAKELEIFAIKALMFEVSKLKDDICKLTVLLGEKT